jgi:hypothetical protein
LSLASAGEIDKACQVLQQVLEVATLINSATVRQDLRQLSRVFSRRRTHEAVRQALPQLAGALRVNTPQPGYMA